VNRSLAWQGALCLVGAAVVYVIAAASAPPGFFDGFAPPAPYRWVSPPSQFKQGNQAPLSGRGQAITNESGQVILENGSLSTDDNQATISFIPGSIETPANHGPVHIQIKPVAQFPDPGGVRLATNVYCFTSTSPVAAGRDVLISLTYSTGIPGPSAIYGYQDNGPWQKIGATGSSAPYSIAAQAHWLGCFAAGSPNSASPSSPGSGAAGGQTLPLLVGVLIVIVLLAALPLLLRRRR
jgi:hypothetical protein